MNGPALAEVNRLWTRPIRGAAAAADQIRTGGVEQPPVPTRAPSAAAESDPRVASVSADQIRGGEVDRGPGPSLGRSAVSKSDRSVRTSDSPVVLGERR